MDVEDSNRVALEVIRRRHRQAAINTNQHQQRTNAQQPAGGGPDLVRSRIEAIPGRLEQIWAESAATQSNPAAVADAMAQKLIGRA
jgi:hypothetical protein